MRNTLSICLFCVTALSASSAQVLNGTEGEKVIFQAAVKTMGTFSFNGAVIGDVTNGQGTLNLDRRFTGRLQWDSSTGLFSITDLKKEDSGEYRVQNNDEGQPKLSVYKLTVYTQNEVLKGEIRKLEGKLGELGGKLGELGGEIGGLKGGIIAVSVLVILCAAVVFLFVIRRQRQLKNDMEELLRDKELKRDGVRGIEDGESSKMMRQEGVMDTEM
ncbi:uncharacterized protein LOC118769943 isoform X2 [Megalops cyprinoides]|uniref:uncharacterized protein LOC118769943 isoform X2 n=1 Tax=Megalops cyprinoides TaxID=118141 RepID=UPI00186508BB|nr:uncharacterized protein LOC118769943 isoform X2 [Megalops cyprinoides]